MALLMFDDWEFTLEFYGGMLIGTRVYNWDDAQRIAIYVPFFCFWITRYDD